jgi:hypothetical protein
MPYCRARKAAGVRMPSHRLLPLTPEVGRARAGIELGRAQSEPDSLRSRGRRLAARPLGSGPVAGVPPPGRENSSRRSARACGSGSSESASPLDATATAHLPGLVRQTWAARLNRQIRLRTGVVGILLERNSIIRLLGAVLAEQHDERADSRRYLALEVLARSRLALITTGDHREDTTRPGAISAWSSTTSGRRVETSRLMPVSGFGDHAGYGGRRRAVGQAYEQPPPSGRMITLRG